MQNIPNGEEFRHVQARLRPTETVREHSQDPQVVEQSRKRLAVIESKDKISLWGKEMSGKEAVWELAKSRIALLDDRKQDAAYAFIRQDISNAKEFIITTNPLVDAYHEFTTQKAEYRQRQEEYRENPPVNITIGAKIQNPVEEAILKVAGYKSPESTPDVVPVATLLSLNVVDMGKLLDTARDDRGNIDQQTLRDSLSQGTEYFNPNQQYNITVYENETGIARRKIKETLESPSMMAIEKSGMVILNQLPRATSTSTDVEVPKIIALTKAIGEIAKDPKILAAMKGSGLLIKSSEERFVIDAVRRITEDLGETDTRVKPRSNDVEAVIFFTNQVRKLIEAKVAFISKMDRAVNEYVDFDEKFQQVQPTTFIADILMKKIVAETQKTDAIAVQDPELRSMWSHVVGSMRNLVQHHYEVEQDVNQLLGVQEV